MTRADGYTEEEIRLWCTCIRNQTPDSFEGPDIECPLHGGFVVEWVTFRRDTFSENDFEPMGTNYVSDEYADEPRPLQDALWRAEDELASIRRYDENNSAYNCEYQLRYRLIGPWKGSQS